MRQELDKAAQKNVGEKRASAQRDVDDVCLFGCNGQGQGEAVEVGVGQMMVSGRK